MTQYSQSESTQQLSFISQSRATAQMPVAYSYLAAIVVTTQVLSNDIARRQVFVTTRYNAELVTLSTSRYYSHISTAVARSASAQAPDGCPLAIGSCGWCVALLTRRGRERQHVGRTDRRSGR